MEKYVEMDRTECNGAPLAVRLLGALAITRDGAPIALPSSRKVRALFAYLALAPQRVSRAQLCELLWDVPNDPRSELRWCLSKIRHLLKEDGPHRLETCADSIRLDLSGCRVDALDIARAVENGVEQLGTEELRTLVDLCAGDFLEGLEIRRLPMFHGWLVAQRQRFRNYRAAVIEHLVCGDHRGETLDHLVSWMRVAPLDWRVHRAFLTALARCGRIAEAEKHLDKTLQLFHARGRDPTPLREAWHAVRSETAPRVQASRASLTAPSGMSVGRGPEEPHRASIAVMPFVDRTGRAADVAGTARGIAHDLITRFAKLRSLFVIAQGSVFALHQRGVGPHDAGRMLNVDYVVSGSLHEMQRRLAVSVELTEVRTARVVWEQMLEEETDSVPVLADELGRRIVTAIASEIEAVECNRAILKSPSSLNAWEAYHRGLWHAYRFNKVDNEAAQHFFEVAVGLDPGFARAYAWLSFAHYQNAFHRWRERQREFDLAFETAGQGLMADDRDPAVHWAMGRALWHRGRRDQSLSELQRAVELSPSFAVGFSTLAYVHAQTGRAAAGVEAADLSSRLSPYDPLLFAMFASRAIACVCLGRFEEAAAWSARAAARPNAHAHIQATAAYSFALASRLDEARAYMEAARKSVPNYDIASFFDAYQFRPADAALFRKAAERIAAG